MKKSERELEKATKDMGKALLHSQAVITMKANGKTTKNMDKVPIPGQTEQCLKVNL